MIIVLAGLAAEKFLYMLFACLGVDLNSWFYGDDHVCI